MTNSYFENIVNATDEYFRMDMIGNARDILTRALHYQNVSLNSFRVSQEAETEEKKRIYWQDSCEWAERAKGLLDAYEILTTRKVMNYFAPIEEEILWIDQTFDVEDVFCPIE